MQKLLIQIGRSTYTFDGDNVLHGLCSDLGFTEEDRNENIRRIWEMVKLFIDAGIIAIAAFISPYQKDRKRIRNLLENGHFFEVFVDCPIEVCEKRDKKGIYAKARSGEIKHFTGISAPYEIPANPDIVIRSDQEDYHQSAMKVFELLKTRGIVCKKE